ncbi:uncharacterized protein LOC110641329 isoform X3 [Hevea brasiliensis]|uniref:uncharacterized protein LOC110641329 isoform X3 n=1 Tax=Hevea brasiliensis TaxID=3981 RepID=UPI0025D1D18A|nr:uncharacterized protein LOC110641329 isoform X3 [Hevea brasiliensis]
MGCSVVTQKHFPFIEGRKDLIFFWLSFALTHTKTKRKREREWQWVHGILEHVRRCEIQQFPETPVLHLSCRKKERERDHIHPYKVIEITPPPKNLGIRCFPPQNLQCGESVTIEGQAYTIAAVTHRYQLRKGKYESSEKRLDVLSTGRYILNLYLENLLEQS